MRQLSSAENGVNDVNEAVFGEDVTTTQSILFWTLCIAFVVISISGLIACFCIKRRAKQRRAKLRAERRAKQHAEQNTSPSVAEEGNDDKGIDSIDADGEVGAPWFTFPWSDKRSRNTRKGVDIGDGTVGSIDDSIELNTLDGDGGNDDQTSGCIGLGATTIESAAAGLMGFMKRKEVTRDTTAESYERSHLARETTLKFDEETGLPVPKKPKKHKNTYGVVMQLSASVSEAEESTTDRTDEDGSALYTIGSASTFGSYERQRTSFDSNDELSADPYSKSSSKPRKGFLDTSKGPDEKPKLEYEVSSITKEDSQGSTPEATESLDEFSDASNTDDAKIPLQGGTRGSFQMEKLGSSLDSASLDEFSVDENPKHEKNCGAENGQEEKIHSSSSLGVVDQSTDDVWSTIQSFGASIMTWTTQQNFLSTVERDASESKETGNNGPSNERSEIQNTPFDRDTVSDENNQKSFGANVVTWPNNLLSSDGKDASDLIGSGDSSSTEKQGSLSKNCAEYSNKDKCSLGEEPWKKSSDVHTMSNIYEKEKKEANSSTNTTGSKGAVSSSNAIRDRQKAFISQVEKETQEKIPPEKGPPTPKESSASKKNDVKSGKKKRAPKKKMRPEIASVQSRKHRPMLQPSSSFGDSTIATQISMKSLESVSVQRRRLKPLMSHEEEKNAAQELRDDDFLISDNISSAESRDLYL